MRKDLKKEIFEKILDFRKNHPDDIIDYNYPGRVFYCTGMFEWLTDQLVDYIGAAMPYAFCCFKDGEAHWDLPIHLGAAEKVLKEIEEKRYAFLEEDREKTKKAYDEIHKWLKDNPLKKNQDLKYYLDKLKESFNVLFENHIYFQISSQIDELLRKKLLEVFKEKEITEELIGLCISKHKNAVKEHEESVFDLMSWCKENNMVLKKENFDYLIKNKEFKQRLQKTYNTGYFLHTSYGGVTLWSLKKEFDELEQRKEKKKQEKKKFKEKDLNEEQKFWIEVNQHYSFLRDKRKTLQQKIYYYQALLLEEIAARTGFVRNDLENLRVDQITLENIRDKNKMRLLIKEQKEMYLFTWIEGGKKLIAIGEEGKKLYGKYAMRYNLNIQEIRGQTASKGYAQGRARIIIDTHRAFTFNKGDILVTGMTAPNFIPIMRKAAAIVTEGGGATCHAAILAREMNKPCIVRTKIATKVLKDGDFIEVDANNGVVRKIR